MLDWDNYRKELKTRIGELGVLSPETLSGYQALSAAGKKTAHLDAKTRELIALAVAVTTRCDGCIAVHAAQAAREGATKEEVAEALGWPWRSMPEPPWCIRPACWTRCPAEAARAGKSIRFLPVPAPAAGGSALMARSSSLGAYRWFRLFPGAPACRGADS